MPKVNKIQTSFNAGELSKQIHGRVDNPRYEQGLLYCQNYIPLVQGPLIRRPGTKYVGYVKDSTKLPVLIPFQFSNTQNYILEFGDKYVRFYQNEGQIVTSSNSFLVTGLYAPYFQNAIPGLVRFTAIRSASTSGGPQESILGTSLISAGSILELTTPFAFADLKGIKFSQKQDTLYLTHPNYYPTKLVRTGLNTWDLKQIYNQDGPYLPLNSYQTIADLASVTFSPDSTGPLINIQAGSSVLISNASAIAISNYIRLTTTTPHGFLSGQKVVVTGVSGTSEVNNVDVPSGTIPTTNITNSSPQNAYWVIGNTTTNTIDLLGSAFSNPYVGSGVVAPAIFQLTQMQQGSSYIWADTQANSSVVSALFLSQRTIGIINPTNALRYYGRVWKVFNAGKAQIILDTPQTLIDTSIISKWYFGAWNNLTGFPSATTFHQDRLMYSGPSSYPQEVDGSMTGQYELFSASGSNSIVNANNAVQFNLNSQDINQIRWMLSSPLGLLAGTNSGEWAIVPSTQNASLSPTNIKADQVTAFGSADSQAIFVGNAAIYIQKAQRKVRELLYYWQVGNFRSTNISELSQHITVPAVTKLVSQREPHPVVWGLRSDGALLSLSYNRDDVTLQANSGWARHILGGKSDTANTIPLVSSIAVIPSGDSTFDEMWLVTQRYMNGSTLGCVEYMTKPFDDFQAQETAAYLDCAGNYSSSIVVTGLSVAGSCIVTASNHGLTNSSTIRFYNTVGMNISLTDINGYVQSSNPINYQTFVVTSASTNNFFIRDFNGNYINTNSCSVYVGSAVVNQLISSISGISWLAGETVSIVADGGIHVNTTISQAGVLTLAYPAAKVNFGYAYNSDAQLLRSKDGSAQGTSIGTTRRVNRVAFMLHNVGDISVGPNFFRLIPAQLYNADANQTDVAPPLFDGILRDGIESDYGFDDTTCFRQSSGLPGMIQSITRFLEEQDV